MLGGAVLGGRSVGWEARRWLGRSAASCGLRQDVGRWWADAEERLEKASPTTHALVLRVKGLRNGASACFADLRAFHGVSKALRSGRAPHTLPRQDLELYVRLPREMARLLAVSSTMQIPLLGDVVIAAALLFPRLLTRHFWTEEQRRAYGEAALERKLRLHSPPLWAAMAGLGLGPDHASPERAAEVLAEGRELGAMHRFHLYRLHHVLPLPGAERRLRRRMELLGLCDAELGREELGGLGAQEVRDQLGLRSLSSHGLSEERQLELLCRWLRASADDAPLLYAHKPLLLQPHTATNLPKLA